MTVKVIYGCLGATGVEETTLSQRGANTLITELSEMLERFPRLQIVIEVRG